MTWIESHDAVINHPKTRKLARRLEVEIPTAVGLLHCLWHWAVDYAEDGDLSKHDAEDIALGAHWSGQPDDFLKALVDCRWIDRDGEQAVLHDWHEYAGRLLERRRVDRERKRSPRGGASDVQRSSTEVPRTGEGIPADRVRTSPTPPTEHDLHDTTDTTNSGVGEVEQTLQGVTFALLREGFDPGDLTEPLSKLEAKLRAHPQLVGSPVDWARAVAGKVRYKRLSATEKRSIKACDQCDDKGWTIDDDSNEARRCDHKAEVAP